MNTIESPEYFGRVEAIRTWMEDKVNCPSIDVKVLWSKSVEGRVYFILNDCGGRVFTHLQMDYFEVMGMENSGLNLIVDEAMELINKAKEVTV